MNVSYLVKWLAASAFLLSAVPALADVYRCQQDNGRTSYQDTPCATGTQKKVDNPASAAPASTPSSPAPDFKPQLAELERKRLIREAISTGVPMVSMTRAELNEAMGSPDKLNSNQNGATSQDQLIYYRQGRTSYVHIKNGVVTSIQYTQGAPSTQPRKSCPSEYEIRRIEIDISKFYNRDNRALQAELRKRLSDAKGCQGGG